MKRLFTSCFGLGLLPLAPGTWGSLPPVAVFALLAYLQVPTVAIVVAMAALVLAGSVVCVMFAPGVATAVGKDDPGEVVADEFAGQALVFIPAVLLSQLQPLLMAGLGFVLFRLFDIAKPWPIRKLEKLPNGWGILADDLLAGVYAAILLLLVSILKSYWAV
ncbi:MAG: phosphatidylglycerophosphatase A [Phycisphaerales bacterium]